MSHNAEKKQKVTYQDILNLPEHMVGEIVDGELFVTPRPRPQHALAASRLTAKLETSFGGGGEGPGGWWILVEPELHLGGEPNNQVLVPDLAGWKKATLPKLPEQDAHISVVQDWVCEILSPSNARLDRAKKVPKYASFGVRHLWLINPKEKTLEAFRLQGDKWLLLRTYVESDKVSIEPFEAIEFNLGALWEES